MEFEVRFEPVEPMDELTGQTLCKLRPFVLALCDYGGDGPGERYRDDRGVVWELIDGTPGFCSVRSAEYKVLEVLGPVLTSPPEKPPEPPTVRLDTLGQQVWVKSYNWPTQSPREARLCCHDGTGRVFCCDQDGVPFPFPAAVSSNYVVVGDPIGQLKIKVSDDG